TVLGGRLVSVQPPARDADGGRGPRHPARSLHAHCVRGRELNRMSAMQRGGLEGAKEVARRRKWLGLAAFSGALAAGVTLAVRLPSLYRSTATVLVEHRQAVETLLPGELEARLQTISEEILSRSRLQELVNRF